MKVAVPTEEAVFAEAVSIRRYAEQGDNIVTRPTSTPEATSPRWRRPIT
jgi:hypothetical protein